MADAAVEQPKIETPAVEAPVAEEPKFSYEYQPVDEEGRPMGGKQVIKAADAQAALDQMAKNHEESMRFARKLKRERALETADTTIPADATKSDNFVPQFKPRELTAEELWQIKQDPSSPESRKLLIESELGADPASVRRVLTQASQDIAALRGRAEADAFCASEPNFYMCEENAQIMQNWMLKNNLAPVQTNFKTAYTKLSGDGLLLEAPPEAGVTPPNDVEDAPPKAANSAVETPPAKRSSVSSSGLTRSNSSGGGTVSAKRVTMEEDAKTMSADDFKKKWIDPALKRQRTSQR